MRKRNYEVLLRLTESEMDILSQKVKASGLSRNAFLVNLIINGIVYPSEPLKDINMRFQEYNRLIAGIANNANQLARRYNSTKTAPPPECLPTILKAVQIIKSNTEPLWDRIRELLYGNR